jgi:predicted ATPase
MIEKITLQNYKCLRDVTLDLSPFTVLIGPNDSGKSSILDAIRVIGRPSSAMLVGGSTRETLVWRANRDLVMRWQVSGRSANHVGEYTLKLPVDGPPRDERLAVDGADAFTLRSGGRDLNAAEAFFLKPAGYASEENSALLYATVGFTTPSTREFIDGISSSRKYRLDPVALRNTAKPEVNPTLSATGDNLAAVLDALITGPDREAINSLEADLRRAVPTLRGVALRTVAEGQGFGKALEFVLAGGGPKVTIPASQASEGALLLTAFLTLVHGDTPDVLLIEEPENGLHPSRLKTVIELLRRVSTGEVGNRPRQVIVTTHSPILLNYVRPEEVRVVQRDPETGTWVRAMTDAPDLPKLLEEFAVGELWYMLGEDGLFARKTS